MKKKSESKKRPFSTTKKPAKTFDNKYRKKKDNSKLNHSAYVQSIHMNNNKLKPCIIKYKQASQFDIEREKNYENAVSKVFNTLDVFNLGKIKAVNIPKTFPQSILYFLGSIFQKIIKQKTELSKNQFFKQAMRIKQKSNDQDISEFIEETKNLKIYNQFKQSLSSNWQKPKDNNNKFKRLNKNYRAVVTLNTLQTLQNETKTILQQVSQQETTSNKSYQIFKKDALTIKARNNKPDNLLNKQKKHIQLNKNNFTLKNNKQNFNLTTISYDKCYDYGDRDRVFKWDKQYRKNKFEIQHQKNKIEKQFQKRKEELIKKQSAKNQMSLKQIQKYKRLIMKKDYSIIDNDKEKKDFKMNKNDIQNQISYNKQRIRYLQALKTIQYSDDDSSNIYQTKNNSYKNSSLKLNFQKQLKNQESRNNSCQKQSSLLIENFKTKNNLNNIFNQSQGFTNLFKRGSVDSKQSQNGKIDRLSQKLDGYIKNNAQRIKKSKYILQGLI